MILTLVNIGPLKETRVELGRGLTVFYGPNASGKTTVARALRLLALMNMGIASVGGVDGAYKPREEGGQDRV
jgi:predicted ATPase